MLNGSLDLMFDKILKKNKIDLTDWTLVIFRHNYYQLRLFTPVLYNIEAIMPVNRKQII